MRVGYHGIADALVIVGAGTYAPLTLAAERDGAGHILIRSLSGRVELACSWEALADLDGATFATPEAALAYLDRVFARPPMRPAVTQRHPAGSALSAPRAVRLEDGALAYASAQVLAHRLDVLGLVTAAAEPGAEVVVVAQGPVRVPGWGLVPERPLFLGSDGLVTQAPPVAPAAFLLTLGVALDPDTALVRLGVPILLQGDP